MRTDKKKIKRWKMVAMMLTFVAAFVFVACQDQIVEEVSKSTISQNGDYPPEVQEHMDKYLKEHPGAKLTYLDGSPEEIDRLSNLTEINKRVVYTYDLKNTDDGVHKKGLLLADIQEEIEEVVNKDNVFVVVEQMPEFPGGYEALKTYIRQNIKYPAGSNGKEGTVYVSMVIDKDGSVTDTKLLRGIDPVLDAACADVIRSLPKWKPGMQNGMAVRTRYNVPFRFEKGVYAAAHDEGVEISQVGAKMRVVQVDKSQQNGSTVVKGRVLDETGKGLPGVNVHLHGTARGTTTDKQGLFSLATPTLTGQLIFSFVGFESMEINY